MMSAVETRVGAPFGRRVSPDSRGTVFAVSEIEQPVGRRFEAIARAHPQRVAVRAPGQQWTYERLNAAANRIARGLQAFPDPGRPVALWLPAGPTLFGAMLGTLKAGRFYVPLDAALGPARLRMVLEAADAAVILTDRSGAADAGRVSGDGARIVRVEEIAADGAPDDLAVAISPDDLAYVLFTSGSTGRPKGVMQSHRNVLHNTLKLTNGLGISPEDRMTLLSSPGYGASVSDIYGALLNGASVCPFPLGGEGMLRLRSFLGQEGITVLHCVPSVFRQLAATLDGTEDLSKLRIVKLGGEPALRSDYELYRQRLPKSCLFHVGLGATEMSVIRQWFADHDTVLSTAIAPLGYEVDGAEIRLLDEHGRETGGDTGEIAVVSRTLSPGYWRRPDLTAEAFALGSGGERLWRTGDLGRMLPDGCLLYLGRKDSRVKVRGHWVDLLELEAALNAFPGVSEAAVVAGQGPGGTRVVAYVAGDVARRPSVGALRKALSERFPPAMIPALFVPVDALPRTENGKLDRGSLPEPDSARPELETPFVAPRDETEERVATIFAEVLRLDRVGANDDFFELGGDSLAAVGALLHVTEAYGKELSAADLLEAPTPAGLAARIRSEAMAEPTGLVTLQGGGTRPPVFLTGAGDGNGLVLHRQLARCIGSDHPFFGFRAGPANVERLVGEYVRRMRSVQPHGPYVLLGECAGGILAFEMARRLISEGERVALLALIDTPFPSKRRSLSHPFRHISKSWSGDKVARRIRHHRQVAAGLRIGHRLRYLLSKARVALKALLGLGESVQIRALLQQTAYVRMLVRHEPAPLPGRVFLIQSEVGSREGLDAAWARVTQGVEVANVPGDRSSYLREHLEISAAVLRRWLDDAFP
jgi:amino acid adenylation domain-containing protein